MAPTIDDAVRDQQEVETSMSFKMEPAGLRRRTVLKRAAHITAGLVAAPALSVSAAPRVVSILVPFGPGSLPDSQYRLLAAELSNPSRTVIIDNRPGASGSVGSRAFARAKADGATLGFGGQGTLATNAYLFKDYGEQVSKRLVPIHGVTATPMLFAASAAAPFKTMKEFIEQAKARPRSINVASTGFSTGSWQIYCLARTAAGIETADIPFQGGAAALTGLLGGQVDAIADYYLNIKPHMESGKVRALAVSSPTRLPSMPDVPTFAEAGLEGVDISTWCGIFGPPGATPEFVAEWSRDFGEVLRRKNVVDTFAGQGSVALADLDSVKFAEFIRTETPRWVQLAQKVGLTAE
jgi:tripartite-type tricarboxylate transporter receptor subunit TctC